MTFTEHLQTCKSQENENRQVSITHLTHTFKRFCQAECVLKERTTHFHILNTLTTNNGQQRKLFLIATFFFSCKRLRLYRGLTLTTTLGVMGICKYHYLGLRTCIRCLDIFFPSIPQERKFYRNSNTKNDATVFFSNLKSVLHSLLCKEHPGSQSK